MKKLVLGLSILAVLSLSACNTIQGAGEDLKGAGEGIADGAHKAKQKIEGN